MVAVSVFHAVVHFAVCDTAGEKKHGIQSGGKLGKCDSSKAVGSEQMGRSNKGTCVWLWLALPAMLWIVMKQHLMVQTISLPHGKAQCL